MVAIPATHARQSVPQYIRSFLAALPRLRLLVRQLELWDQTRFEARKNLDLRSGQIQSQLFASSITFIQLMTSLRGMRRTMQHHCRTYSIALDDCPTATLAMQIEADNGLATYRHVLEAVVDKHASDYRPGYARALALEDDGRWDEAFRQYAALVAGPTPGAYALMRAGQCAPSAPEAENAYGKAVELYPNFALAQRALGEARRDRDPLNAAEHYSNALLHSPRLEYGEQSWVIAKQGLVEIELYQGFRIFLSQVEGRCIAHSKLLGIPKDGASARAQGFRHRFLGLALMRFHKDKIWRRDRRAATTVPDAAPGRAAGDEGRPGLDSSLNTLLWMGLGPLRSWVIGHFRYFQFLLVGTDVADVKHQIDRIHEQWMRDGAL